MTVSNISSLTAGISRTLNSQNARVASSLQSLASGSRPTSASVDVSSLAISSDLRNQLSGLRANAQNIAQATALTDVASGATAQITASLAHLQQLTVQASSGTLSEADRQTLNTEFQSVRQTIDTLANNTQFGGQTLLDGSASAQASLPAVSGLTDQNLFNGADINLQTADNATAASTAVATAQNYVAAQVSTLGTISENLQFTAANVNSAIQNQEAARSNLSDTDFTQASTESSLITLQTKSTEALLAQTNKLSPSALTLLVE